MNMLMPSGETIFTEEYWGEAVELAQEDRPRAPMLNMVGETNELCAKAATAILAGEELESVPDGTTLDRSPDNRFTQPGVVLLVDRESLEPAEGDEPLEVKTPYWKSKAMASADELMAPAASIFRAHSYRELWPVDPMMSQSKKELRTMARPYRKALRDIELGMDYTRTLDLVVIAYDKDGGIFPFRRNSWATPNPQEVIGEATFKELFKDGLRMRVPVDVGATYKSAKNNDEVFRIRSVDICLRGSLQYAPSRRWLKIPSFAGRLASAPQTT